MSSLIAFFPWVRLDEPLTIGDLRLLPYERGEGPGDHGSVTQSDIDSVLAAYATRKNRIAEQATLIEFGEWHLGQESTAEIRADLFRAREFVAFAALAKCRLFRGHFDYCNSDNYALVLQNYEPGRAGTFSFFTRRRDGGAQRLWGANDFAFFKPLHADSNTKVTLDEPLLHALLAADDSGDAPYDAIVEFNRANTDSQDIQIHTELVLAKSALEFLFSIGHDVNDLVNALLPLVCQRVASTTFDGPLAARWPSLKGNRQIRLLESWAREFCVRRNESAHGKRRRGRDQFVWSDEAHLAFIAVLFPLLVKRQLAQKGFLQMNETDDIELAWIETYLTYDPFSVGPDGRSPEPHEHPWNLIYSEGVLGEKLRRELVAQWERLSPTAADPDSSQ